MGYFGVVGGDRRQLYAARSLEKRGWNVLLAGWEPLFFCVFIDFPCFFPSACLQ